jgi:hypothetical protein
MNYVFKKLNIKVFKTKSFGNVKLNLNYKNHYWFKIKKTYSKIIKFNTLNIDIITDIIAEENNTIIDWDKIPDFPTVLDKLFYDKREKEIIKKEHKKEYKIVDNEILDLLNILTNFRKDNFKEWSLVGLALKNTNEDLLGVFNDWSKDSPKYNGFSDVKKYWDSFKNKDDGVTLGSIRFWAKIDHPTLYNKWYNKYHFVDFIEEDINNNTYDNVKNDFKAFKILNPLCYCYPLDGEIVINKRATFKDTFENLNITVKTKDKTKSKSFINLWLKDKDIPTYNKLDFLPRSNPSNKIFNTFTGFEIEHKEPLITGNLKESRIWEHLYNLSCRDDKIFNYMLKWLALRVQAPSKVQNYTSIVIKGVEGTGKNIFFDWFGKNIIGMKYYNSIQQLDNIFGKFNSQLRDKILIVINELDSKAFKYTEEIKDSIVGETLKIQQKGLDPFNITNNTGFIFITNNFNVLNISQTDRRFVLLDIGDRNAQNANYFNPLVEEMKSKKYDYEFYNYLMNLDITNYDFQNNRPITEYYRDIQTLNRPIIIDFFIYLYDKYINKNNIEIKANDLYIKMIDFINENGFNYQINNKKFSLLISKYDFVKKIRKTKGIYYLINVDVLKNYLTSKNYLEDLEFIE